MIERVTLEKDQIVRLITQQVIIPAVNPPTVEAMIQIIRLGCQLNQRVFMINSRYPRTAMILQQLRERLPARDLILFVNNVPTDGYTAHYVNAGADGIVDVRSAHPQTKAACGRAIYVPTASLPGTLGLGLDDGDMQRFITNTGVGINQLKKLVVPPQGNGPTWHKVPNLLITGDDLTPEKLDPFLQIGVVRAIALPVADQDVLTDNWDAIGKRLQRAKEIVREVRGPSR